jgi:cbb3-type cytochrome oxidase subunit 1
MSKTLLRCAVLYSLLGIGLGIVMAASGDFTNKGVHVHLNLVGWVSMAVMAMAYKAFPGMAGSPLAKAQFWLHNLGLPVMAFGIFAVLHRLPMAEPIVGSGSMVVALAFICFALNVWRNAGQ